LSDTNLHVVAALHHIVCSTALAVILYGNCLKPLVTCIAFQGWWRSRLDPTRGHCWPLTTNTHHVLSSRSPQKPCYTNLPLTSRAVFVPNLCPRSVCTSLKSGRSTCDLCHPPLTSQSSSFAISMCVDARFPDHSW
jgi:hypothetical protein